ncbi:outer membrane beta-barrel protein [Catalinimonas niigatensis]|uniref:outer membrane beta-barrel protein n=1 Tax=Catalinimonas niigatensis TaxID=1397264 RepID=UPI002665193F|nr:outer membrane beta-barrel protein [Catalinimonas niigatensis]WPP50700.1 outer membrane beta-barrel protein [Catalinimonas niigatensis]
MEIPVNKAKANQKMYGRGLGMLCFIFFSFTAQSQDLKLTGTLLAEDDQTSLPGATVQLIYLADSAHLFTTTNENGLFGFAALKKGDYSLSISYVGYQSVLKHIELESDQEFSQLLLTPKAEMLNEIEIFEKLPDTIQKGDTTEINAQAYKTQPDASAEDLLRKMPGIIMVNGVVQAQGEDVKQVLVDGKPFFGNDPSAALKNLPAEVIAKIQVFEKQSDQSQFTGFDDGQSQKTINIVTQPDKRNGQFGKIYTGYGLNNRYGVGGNINLFNGNRRYSVIGQSNNINVQNFATEDLLGVVGGAGQSKRRGRGSSGGDASNFLVNQQNGISRTHSFGINYSDNWTEKTEVSGSYFFNNSSNSADQSLSREVLLSVDSSLFYDENTLSASRNYNHRFHLKMIHKMDERNSIIYQPNLSYQKNFGSAQSSAANYLEQGNLLNSTLNNHNTDLTGFNFSNDLLYRRRFEKKGRTFSLRVNALLKQQTGENSLLSANALYTQDAIREDSVLIHQSGILDNISNTYAAYLTYTEPVGERFNLQMNYEASRRNSDSEKLTYNFEEHSQSYTQLDSVLSNQFISQYFTQTAGTGIRYHQGKLSLTTKVNFQLAKLSSDQFFPSETSFNRTFQNVLPSAMLQYRKEDGSNFRVAYRTSTSAPDVQDLQNVINNNNPLVLRQGNPALRQQYQHQLNGRFGVAQIEKSSSFFVMLGGSYTQDYVGRSTRITSQDTLLQDDILLRRGAQLIRPVNFKSSWNIRSFMSYGLPVNSLKSNLNFNSSVKFNRNPGMINDQMNYANNVGFGLGWVLSSNKSEQFDFTLSSHSNYNLVQNTLRRELNNNYFNHSSELKLHARTGQGLFAETDVNHQFYTGLSTNFNQNFWLLNLSVGKKIFKHQLGELKLTVFDLLNQNNSISRNVGEAYVEDVQTSVLNRFALLTFTYQLRNFHI